MTYRFSYWISLSYVHCKYATSIFNIMWLITNTALHTWCSFEMTLAQARVYHLCVQIDNNLQLQFFFLFIHVEWLSTPHTHTHTHTHTQMTDDILKSCILVMQSYDERILCTFQHKKFYFCVKFDHRYITHGYKSVIHQNIKKNKTALIKS